MWLTALLSAFGGPLVDLVKAGITAFSRNQEHRAKIEDAKVDAQVAELKAKAEIAAYKVKADVEWDLKWADQAGTSWKDEYILILWSLPTIALFIPGLQHYVIDGFTLLKAFNPDAPTWFMAGWGVIFAATFGMKQALSFMMPAKYAQLAQVMGTLGDDIPDEVAAAAQAKISAGK